MSNTVNYYLEMAKLQIATEAFWDKWDPITNKDTSSTLTTQDTLNQRTHPYFD